jgi:hypothetical protein
MGTPTVSIQEGVPYHLLLKWLATGKVSKPRRVGYTYYWTEDNIAELRRVIASEKAAG